MSLVHGRTYKTELQYSLKSAGLPMFAGQIIGRVFRFGCQHGSHHHILVGTITAIEVSDEGGVELLISSPRMWGKPIKSIRHTTDGWAVSLNVPPEKVPERLSGEEIDGFVYPSNVYHREFELL